MTKVVGTLCENNDWFAGGPDCGGRAQADQELPSDADVKDLFVIHDTGAHSHSMGFQYNGKLRAPELLLRSASTQTKPVVQQIRARDTIEGLYANTTRLDDVLTPMQKRSGRIFTNPLHSYMREYWGVGAIIATTLVLNALVSYKVRSK